MELKIKALSPKIGADIPLPRFATAGAACMDLYACIDQPVTLAAGERRLIPTGIAIAQMCIRDRPGGSAGGSPRCPSAGR